MSSQLSRSSFRTIPGFCFLPDCDLCPVPIMRAEDNRHPIEIYRMMNIQSPDHVKNTSALYMPLSNTKKNF